MQPTQSKASRPSPILRPERVRRIDQSPFAWLDARLLFDGWLAAFSPEQLAVYIFLCLAANRQGVSWYRSDRISALLGIDPLCVRRSIQHLIDLELVAFKPFSASTPEGFYQVLSLPPDGPSPQPTETSQAQNTLSR